jgi:aspartokinase
MTLLFSRSGPRNADFSGEREAILRSPEEPVQANEVDFEADSIAVVKLGGSVFRNSVSYQRAANFLAQRLVENPTENVVAVVSAQSGETDALLREALGISAEPDDVALDLLWSTGELRSVARLCLHLQAEDVRAAALDVRQTGLRIEKRGAGVSRAKFDSSGIRNALRLCRAVVVPGFLATDAAGKIVTLGRGGSDLTAVVIAAGLGASRCELIKDVAGYFSADPHREAGARHLPILSFAEALAMTDGGCELVQRDALEAAERWDVPLLVRSLEESAVGTWVFRAPLSSEVALDSDSQSVANSLHRQADDADFSKVQSAHEN